MKKLSFPCLIIILVIMGCTPLVRPVQSLDESASISIECRNEIGLTQTIFQRLRMVKAKDLKVGPGGDFIRIDASFRLRETPLYKIGDMKLDLEQIPGVVSVMVDINKTVVKQAF